MKPGTQAYNEREAIAEAYRRILNAARAGKGCRLTAYECGLIQYDDAICANVEAFDYEIKNGQH